jgi:hypothetical protein
MLAAVAAEGHSPTISRKPGMSFGGWPVSNCTWAGIEGVEIALYPGGVYEKVSSCSTDTEEPVGVGDHATAGNALVNLATVATNNPKRREKAVHVWLQHQVG